MVEPAGADAKNWLSPAVASAEQSSGILAGGETAVPAVAPAGSRVSVTPAAVARADANASRATALRHPLLCIATLPQVVLPCCAGGRSTLHRASCQCVRTAGVIRSTFRY